MCYFKSISQSILYLHPRLPCGTGIKSRLVAMPSGSLLASLDNPLHSPRAFAPATPCAWSALSHIYPGWPLLGSGLSSSVERLGAPLYHCPSPVALPSPFVPAQISLQSICVSGVWSSVSVPCTRTWTPQEQGFYLTWSPVRAQSLG